MVFCCCMFCSFFCVFRYVSCGLLCVVLSYFTFLVDPVYNTCIFSMFSLYQSLVLSLSDSSLSMFPFSWSLRFLPFTSIHRFSSLRYCSVSFCFCRLCFFVVFAAFMSIIFMRSSSLMCLFFSFSFFLHLWWLHQLFSHHQIPLTSPSFICSIL